MPQDDPAELREWAKRVATRPVDAQPAPRRMAREDLRRDRPAVPRADQVRRRRRRDLHRRSVPAELSEIDFDVAIVDEAGQIGTNTALVPLARARAPSWSGTTCSSRRSWTARSRSGVRRSATPASATSLPRASLNCCGTGSPTVTGSCCPTAPDARQIADFISAQFYGGLLSTAVRREHRDPLFASPMAFVDTSGLPAAHVANERLEHGSLNGYTNPAEAAMLAGLAAFYHRLKVDWAVILPYKAQVKEVRARVDAADRSRGGHRPQHRHGRRLPGRRTRRHPARLHPQQRRGERRLPQASCAAPTSPSPAPGSQLVLIGDLRTLTRARDPGFRALARSLHDHLRAHGEIRPYAEIRTLLETHERPPDPVRRRPRPRTPAFALGRTPTRILKVLLPVHRVESRRRSPTPARTP